MLKLAGYIFATVGGGVLLVSILMMAVSPQDAVIASIFFALPSVAMIVFGNRLIRRARWNAYSRAYDQRHPYQPPVAPYQADVTPARGMPIPQPSMPQQHYPPAPQVVYVQQAPPLSKRDQRLLKQAKQNEFNRGCAALVMLIIFGAVFLSGGRVLTVIGNIFNTPNVLAPSDNRAGERRNQTHDILTLSEASSVLKHIQGVVRVDNFNTASNKVIVSLKVTDEAQSIATAQMVWRTLDNAMPDLNGGIFLIYDEDEIFTYGYDEGGIWMTENMLGVVQIPR